MGTENVVRETETRLNRELSWDGCYSPAYCLLSTMVSHDAQHVRAASSNKGHDWHESQEESKEVVSLRVKNELKFDYKPDWKWLTSYNEACWRDTYVGMAEKLTFFFSFALYSLTRVKETHIYSLSYFVDTLYLQLYHNPNSWLVKAYRTSHSYSIHSMRLSSTFLKGFTNIKPK